MRLPTHLPRGVYRLPYTDLEGRPLVVAVDRRGRRIEERAVWPGEEVEIVAGEMRQVLDDVDPVGPH